MTEKSKRTSDKERKKLNRNTQIKIYPNRSLNFVEKKWLTKALFSQFCSGKLTYYFDFVHIVFMYFILFFGPNVC